MAPTLTPDRSTFRTLVADVAARAKAILPQAVNGRVESAVKLVLVQDVQPQADGSILVGSSTDALKTYRLVGTTCECQDFTRGQAPEGWCQHRIAAGIHKRVQAQLAAQGPTPVEPPVEPWPDNDVESTVPQAPEPPAVPVPQGAPLPEAPFSCTLKGTVHGHDTLLTVRAWTAPALLANLAQVGGVLDPVSSAPQGGPTPAAPQAKRCRLHPARPMKAGRKPGTYFCTHRYEDGTYCQERES